MSRYIHIRLRLWLSFRKKRLAACRIVDRKRGLHIQEIRLFFFTYIASGIGRVADTAILQLAERRNSIPHPLILPSRDWSLHSFSPKDQSEEGCHIPVRQSTVVVKGQQKPSNCRPPLRRQSAASDHPSTTLDSQGTEKKLRGRSKPRQFGVLAGR